eukprot:GHVU01192709.1.p2 GENE.GHVU01192709.1~~GHVU01192709.1.p2  ORF type:complete len:113 (+),score=3.21 GHVU01192709.1:891-1229(+)
METMNQKLSDLTAMLLTRLPPLPQTGARGSASVPTVGARGSLRDRSDNDGAGRDSDSDSSSSTIPLPVSPATAQEQAPRVRGPRGKRRRGTEGDTTAPRDPKSARTQHGSMR